MAKAIKVIPTPGPIRSNKRKFAMWFAAVLLAGLLAVFLLASCGGCRMFSKPPVEQQAAASAAAQTANSEAQMSLAGAKELNRIIAGDIEAAKPHTNDVGKGHLISAGQSADRQKVVLANVGASVDKEREAQVATNKAFLEENQKRLHLEGQWYVVWGLRIEHAIWAFIGIWAVASLVSLWMGISPFKWVAWLGVQLETLLPVANGTRWARKSILKRRAAR